MNYKIDPVTGELLFLKEKEINQVAVFNDQASKPDLPLLFLDHRSVFTTSKPILCKTMGEGTLKYFHNITANSAGYQKTDYFISGIFPLLSKHFEIHMLMKAQSEYANSMYSEINEAVKDALESMGINAYYHDVIKYDAYSTNNYIREAMRNYSKRNMAIVTTSWSNSLLELLTETRGRGNHALAVLTGMLSNLIAEDVSKLCRFSADAESVTKEHIAAGYIEPDKAIKVIDTNPTGTAMEQWAGFHSEYGAY